MRSGERLHDFTNPGYLSVADPIRIDTEFYSCVLQM
jgi:hypothetical protein